MRKTTVEIPEDLERAVESYRDGLDFPIPLSALMRDALAEYLSHRGYPVENRAELPSMMENAPKNRGAKTASDIVIEDRI